MTRALRGFTLVVVAFAASLLNGTHASALEPSEIALVVNTRVPASKKLAELYAAERHIPDGRIIELDIDPVTPLYPAEEIAFSEYDAKAAVPIRRFLVEHELRSQVKCLVTFYGVPFRIGRRVLTAEEQAEAAMLPKELQATSASVLQQVAVIEQIVRSYDPAFNPAGGTDPRQLDARMRAAVNAAVRVLQSETDQKIRHEKLSQIAEAIKQVNGQIQATVLLSQPVLAKLQENPPTPEQAQMARQQMVVSGRQLLALREAAKTTDARTAVRKFAGERFGLLAQALLTRTQADDLNTSESESALDSELAALWWIDYPRARWVANPLNWRLGSMQALVGGPTLMVTRLDGPSEMSVENLIKRSFEAEQKGLTGIAVIDARGKPVSDPYGRYDQTLRNLADLLKAKSKMPVILDNEEPVIRYHSIHQPIAIYCGWYSLRNYMPPGDFTPGAVALHVASFEMISLRARNEKGWVRGLILDGVGATVGPVAEPYLQSFPPADEFFPLLLTGKLTLAEAYWRTTPMVSWMQCCIGDPLYNPFLHDPQLNMSDLPDRIQLVRK